MHSVPQKIAMYLLHYCFISGISLLFLWSFASSVSIPNSANHYSFIISPELCFLKDSFSQFLLFLPQPAHSSALPNKTEHQLIRMYEGNDGIWPWTAFNLRIPVEILDTFTMSSLSRCVVCSSIALWPVEQLQPECWSPLLHVNEDKNFFRLNIGLCPWPCPFKNICQSIIQMTPTW